MNLKGERVIPASVERTWLALNDPQTLKACINGCESIESTGENQYLAVMAVRIGPVNARFKGRLQLSDIVPMQSYKINFDGQGGVAGFGKGSAAVTLAPVGTGGESTTLNYVADAQVGGKIAQIGSRLVESAAAKIADDFFKAFEAKMTDPAAAVPGATDAAAGTDTATTGTAGGTGGGLAGGAMGGSAGGLGGGATSFATTGSGPAGVGGAGSSTGSAGLDQAAQSRTYTGDAALSDPVIASAGAMPMGAAQPLGPAAGLDPQPQARATGSSTVWWIAGIIILALLVYFFTR